MATIRKPYVTVQVTLTANSAPAQQLWALANAIDSGIPQSGVVVNIQADPANTFPVLFGDDLTTASRYGFSMGGGDAKSYVGNHSVMSFGHLHAFTTGAGQKINIEVMGA